MGAGTSEDSISGIVFQDLNNTGRAEPGNPGQAGAVVLLVDEGGAQPVVVGVAITAQDGSFSFSGLPAGTYRVVVPEGMNPGLMMGRLGISLSSGTGASIVPPTLAPAGRAEPDDTPSEPALIGAALAEPESVLDVVWRSWALDRLGDLDVNALATRETPEGQTAEPDAVWVGEELEDWTGALSLAGVAAVALRRVAGREEENV